MENRSLKSYRRIAWLIIIGMTILLIDFLSKAYVYHLLPMAKSSGANQGMAVFQDFLGVDLFISLAFNKGAAWGIFANFQTLLLIIRILIVVGMLVYLFFINQNVRASLPLVLIVSGAIGNIVDFFLYGFVIDFLHFNLWRYHFPVFNFADTSITIGVFWLFIVASISRKSPSYHSHNQIHKP